MADLSEYELQKGSDGTPPPEPGRSAKLWIVTILLVAAAATAAYIVFFGRSAPEPDATVSDAQTPGTGMRPLGGDPAPVAVPPLEESDPLVRELVRQLSSHPQVAAWLTTDGLIRNFTVSVVNVANGRTPAGHLGVLRPASGFLVIESGEDLVIDPRSYERYNAIAAAAASLDPAGSARLYATLKPRVEEAYRDLGFPDASFDRALERAIVRLLQTPVIDDPIRVEPKGIGYGFADPGLESLTSAQKQLLRTGPGNVRAIQASLRAIALALGIPADRLPPAQ